MTTRLPFPKHATITIATIALCIAALVLLGMLANTTHKPDPLPKGDSDGRTASCTTLTEEGVTEHLDAFAARCATYPPGITADPSGGLRVDCDAPNIRCDDEGA